MFLSLFFFCGLGLDESVQLRLRAPQSPASQGPAPKTFKLTVAGQKGVFVDLMNARLISNFGTNDFTIHIQLILVLAS